MPRVYAALRLLASLLNSNRTTTVGPIAFACHQEVGYNFGCFLPC